jgi:hypothetical protein
VAPFLVRANISVDEIVENRAAFAAMRGALRFSALCAKGRRFQRYRLGNLREDSLHAVRLDR